MAKKGKRLSELSYSDSELDMIDWDASSLKAHSHFFAPSGHPHNRYSTPLIIISSGQGSADRGVISSGGAAAAGHSSGSSSGAPSPSPASPTRSFPHSTSRSKLIVPAPTAQSTMNGHSEEDVSQRQSAEAQSTDDMWPVGRLYVNKDSLVHDLSFLANMPELCDVTFLVGEERQPICAVRAILAARSR